MSDHALYKSGWRNIESLLNKNNLRNHLSRRERKYQCPRTSLRKTQVTSSLMPRLLKPKKRLRLSRRLKLMPRLPRPPTMLNKRRPSRHLLMLTSKMNPHKNPRTNLSSARTPNSTSLRLMKPSRVNCTDPSSLTIHPRKDLRRCGNSWAHILDQMINLSNVKLSTTLSTPWLAHASTLISSEHTRLPLTPLEIDSSSHGMIPMSTSP